MLPWIFARDEQLEGGPKRDVSRGESQTPMFRDKQPALHEKGKKRAMGFAEPFDPKIGISK